MTREIVVVVRVSKQKNSVCVVYANFLKLFIKLNKKRNT